jgi:hypothetical protein
VTRGDYALALGVGPALAAVCFWAIYALSYRTGANSPFVLAVALVPPLAGAVWGISRHPSLARSIGLILAVTTITGVLTGISFYVVVLVAAAQCPDDAYECPI